MSIEVRVPEEIENYKESLVFGLSGRQLVWGAVALFVGLPLFFGTRKLTGNDYISFAVALPVITLSFCMGFKKFDGYNFETFAKIMLYSLFSKDKRGYEYDSEANAEPIEVETFRAEIQKKRKEEERKKIEDSLSNKKGGIHIAHKQSKIRCKKKIKRTTIPEYELVEVSEKTIQRKRKNAATEIKVAARKNRKSKSKKEKAA